MICGGCADLTLPDLAFGAALLVLVGAIGAIDARRRIIPDELNLLLALAGLGHQVSDPGGAPLAALLWGCGTFLAMWVFAAGFRRARGVTGLGFGDVKMAGAAAMWVAPWNIPLLLFAACLSALGFAALAAVLGRGLERMSRVPFGPFIGAGLVLTWMLEQMHLPTLAPLVG